MRRYQKNLCVDLLRTLEEAHGEIKKNIETGNSEMAAALLEECQQGAVSVGNTIEESEGESCPTIHILEEYCELVYQIHEELLHGETESAHAGKIYKRLRKSLMRILESLNGDIKIRREAVFLPYKISMWDSLESVWKAARKDPDCDTYVIPIPYYDKNPDGSFREMHYEGELFPEDISVVKYDEFDFGTHRPDMIFIHNPYDNTNYVTSVHPFFYSSNIKQYTDCLVYIPYYATSGGMSEVQTLLPAYIHADYIVIQSEKYRKYFDSAIPDEKFLPFGSPKFDSVINKCKNPPEPPAEWKEKMAGKKVYFFNTSINGMLDNTEYFLKKMNFVFNLFRDRKDACLLWRPHPLLESTFDSMRPEYRPAWDALKKRFLEEDIGIFDTTPSIENTIALSDIYIGDGGSSVVSLFGVVGKPIFLIHHRLYELPTEEDREKTVYTFPSGDRQNKYRIMPGNQLYYSPENDLHYRYYRNLSEYAGGGYYSGAIEYGDRVYVTPANAQHFLVVDKHKKIRKLELERGTEQPGAFRGYWYWEDKIYLLPNRYPSFVILDLKTEEITYFRGVRDFNVATVGEERIGAGTWIWRNKAYFLNPEGTGLLSIRLDTLEHEISAVNFHRLLTGVAAAVPDDDVLWMLPYEGTVITKWIPETGEMRDYDIRVDGLKSVHRKYKTECNIGYIGSVGFCRDKMIFTPNWSNKFIAFYPETGKAEEWISPFPVVMEDASVYRGNGGMGFLIRDRFDFSYRYVYLPERKTYDIDLETKECREVKVSVDGEDLLAHTPGFSGWSQWTQYVCMEDIFNTLKDLLDDNIHGHPFDREKQRKAYAVVNASTAGDCGEKVYRYVIKKLN